MDKKDRLAICEAWTPDCVYNCQKWRNLKRGTVNLSHIIFGRFEFYHKKNYVTCRYKNIDTRLVWYDEYKNNK